MSRLPLRSVGARLTLALLVVVAGALAVVYLIVVPALEQRLIEAREDQVRRAARDFVERLRDAPEGFVISQQLAERVASTTNTRAVMLQVVDDSPLTLATFADAGGGGDAEDLADDPVARRAVSSFSRQEGIGRARRKALRRDGRARRRQLRRPRLELAERCRRDRRSRRAPPADRRCARAALPPCCVGYGGARFFARRIRRLEQAADRIAGGRFDEPVIDTAQDELGQLARAFDRMRERLAQLERARREFIANASHELRTPLFSLGGHLELLTEEELDEPTRHEFLVRMREQVARLTKLAEELLDLSRLDAGHLHLERAPVDLGRVAELLLEEFESVARNSEHSLELSDNAEIPALGDEQRVLQIGRALVENALRHTPPGTRVRIRTARNDGRAALAVEDDGPGIPAEHAPHVFERFYRSDGTLASGSGLGLAIASELAEVMEGEIDLESRPGRTVFRVWLPAASLSE